MRRALTGVPGCCLAGLTQSRPTRPQDARAIARCPQGAVRPSRALRSRPVRRAPTEPLRHRLAHFTNTVPRVRRTLGP